ncbi:GntR family transcriptional regulator [Chelatococcus sp. GCM10030263]|uniref:GntR family transcriptional regulator n=1 Tax=Chelatococcus sp. GCM10030263 TaxID=3273387 RepID=UPI003609E154
MRLSEIVYNTLKRSIESHRLPDGLILEVATVARLFRLSRTPVAAALEALSNEKIIRVGPGRGYVVGQAGIPFREDLEAAGLKLPRSVTKAVVTRSWRSQFYPAVEQEIAACLPFGRFAINASRLALHYGVSRTIAHETLVRLERLGLVRQQSSRWYARSLTICGLRDHYEMRWILEPRALEQAAPLLPPGLVERSRKRAAAALEGGSITIHELDRMERDLHRDIVLRCPSPQMAEAIRRSQLPLMATNRSLNSERATVMAKTVVEHLEVLEALAAGDVSAAASALEAHLHAAFEVVRATLDQGPIGWEPPPYMVREDP